jgi:hypothetical protein
MSYKAIAAGQTDSVVGRRAGDFLSHVVIQPTTTGAGTVVVKDNATTIFTFTSGTLSNLAPITVPFGISSFGELTITTGSNVTALAVGRFS